MVKVIIQDSNPKIMIKSHSEYRIMITLKSKTIQLYYQNQEKYITEQVKKYHEKLKNAKINSVTIKLENGKDYAAFNIDSKTTNFPKTYDSLESIWV